MHISTSQRFRISQICETTGHQQFENYLKVWWVQNNRLLTGLSQKAEFNDGGILIMFGDMKILKHQNVGIVKIPERPTNTLK